MQSIMKKSTKSTFIGLLVLFTGCFSTFGISSNLVDAAPPGPPPPFYDTPDAVLTIKYKYYSSVYHSSSSIGNTSNTYYNNGSTCWVYFIGGYAPTFSTTDYFSSFNNATNGGLTINESSFTVNKEGYYTVTCSSAGVVTLSSESCKITDHSLSIGSSITMNYRVLSMQDKYAVIGIKYEDSDEITYYKSSDLGICSSESYYSMVTDAKGYVTVTGQTLSLKDYKKTFTQYLWFVGKSLDATNNLGDPVETTTYSLNTYLTNKASTDTACQNLLSLCQSYEANSNGDNITAVDSSSVLTSVSSKRLYRIDNDNTIGANFSHVDISLGEKVSLACSFNYDTSYGTCSISETIDDVEISSAVYNDKTKDPIFATAPFYYANLATKHVITMTSNGGHTSKLSINGYEYIYLGLKQSSDPAVINVLVALYNFAESCSAAAAS